MEEQKVDFETAKLAKEKGFNILCLHAYRVWREKIRKSDTNPLEEIQAELEPYTQCPMPEITYFSQSKKYTLAPTQSLLQKWLREVHNIDVQCKFNSSLFRKLFQKSHNKTALDYHWFMTTNTKDEDYFFEEFSSEETYKTYEEALEEGLKEALKLIK